jgi:hypothetical protein
MLYRAFQKVLPINTVNNTNLTPRFRIFIYNSVNIVLSKNCYEVDENE